MAQEPMSKLKKGDLVVMVGLQSKPQWNGKTAEIIGSFQKTKQRWPIRITFGNQEQALLKPTNLKLQRKESTESQPSFNVVEMEQNRGGGIGPLLNQMRNRKFTNSELAKYIKRHQMKQYSSPFASLLGYELVIYSNPKSGSTENNAAAVYLTTELDNGLSPHQNLPGNSIVVCKNKSITSDRLWGMLNFIWESMGYYDGEYEQSGIPNADNRTQGIQREVREYKAGTWTPRAGTGGIDIYCDDVDACKINNAF